MLESWMLRYKKGGDVWLQLADGPNQVYWQSLVNVDNQVNMVGGWGGTSTTYRGIYWLNANGWNSNGTSYTGYLPGTCVRASQIYIHSGYRNGHIAAFYVFNPGNGIITTLSMGPSARYGHSLAAVGDMIYLFGGRVSGGTMYNTHQVYDPYANKWTVLPNGPDVSYGHAAVVVGTDIYYIGGVGSSGSARYTVYKYSTTSNTWTTVASIPTAFYYAAAGYYNGKIYIHGGNGNYTLLSDMQIYDIASNTWSSKPTPTGVRYGHSGAFVNGKFYIHGGYNNNNVFKDVWVYTP